MLPLTDVQRFRALLHAPSTDARPELHNFFDPAHPITIARAPGRLDVMGGIADYSGSLVLQWPLAEATFAAVQRTSDESRTLHIISMSSERQNARRFSMALADFERDGEPVDNAAARALFVDENAWAAYVAGVFLVLMRERGARFAGGVRILLHSEVPEGKGVSSSAALEVATMRAVAAAFDLSLSGRDLALLCQTVENEVVGAPCGVMDQMTSACGEAGKLLAILCQPAEVQGTVALPATLALWGIDSGVRHAVSGADYGAVRVGAFMGRRIIQVLGAESSIELRGGHLANLSPSLFEQHVRQRLPVSMVGGDFLARYGSTGDEATAVEPARTYAVRQPTAHPIHEHSRVRTFLHLLQASDSDARALHHAPLLGELMYGSHASYSACGLGSTATDRLVELARETGIDGGIFGAKITGGGSGGTVALLTCADAEPSVHEIAHRYAKERGYEPRIFQGSSPGAMWIEPFVVG